jgi:outer membrane receptor protein involved in Fe transport
MEIADLVVNYSKKKYEVGLAIENLLNQEWNESQFDYPWNTFLCET